MVLDQIPIAGPGFIALSHLDTPTGVTRLASPKNSDDFACEIYATLRKVDDLGFLEVVVEQPQGQGIEIATRDRLSPAAQGR